jgi:hypothetical protein
VRQINVRNSGECFRCGGTGHWVDACPELIPAANEAEHFGRIRKYIDRWAEGLMSLEQKRVAVSYENTMWYGDRTPRQLTYPPRGN